MVKRQDFWPANFLRADKRCAGKKGFNAWKIDKSRLTGEARADLSRGWTAQDRKGFVAYSVDNAFVSIYM